MEILRGRALKSVADLELVMVEDQGFPFRIPRRFDNLPRLEGRAEVELILQSGSSPGDKVRLVAVLDGYSAPLNAGNFVDLVQRGVYKDARIQNGEKGFYMQIADKTGFFGDPKLGLRRNVPMEVLVVGEKSPLYGFTLDEAGAGDLQPVLPVTAFGALASYHSIEDPNDASSQWYIFLFDPRSYQARSMGGNALNGSVSCFGYMTEGKDMLTHLQPGDTIVSAKVLSGLNHFRRNAESPPDTVS
jgi:peptidylprolyl isomerase